MLARYGRTEAQCAQRWHKVLQPGLVKGLWTAEEDERIVDGMRPGSAARDDWAAIADAIPGRVAKQCRERWVNHLDPRLRKGAWSADEDALLGCARGAWGNAWKRIAALLPGRARTRSRTAGLGRALQGVAAERRGRCARARGRRARVLLARAREPEARRALQQTAPRGGELNLGCRDA